MPGLRAVCFAAALSGFPISGAWSQAQPPQPLPPRTIAGIVKQLDQFQPDTARIEAIRKRLAAEPPGDPSPKTQRDFYFGRAWAAQQVGASTRQIADLRKSVEFGEKLGGDDLAVSLETLSIALFFGGNFIEGVRVRERIIPLVQGNAGRQISLYSGFVAAYLYFGQLQEARDALQRAESAYAEVGRGPSLMSEFWEGTIHRMRGLVLAAERKYDQAEAALRRGAQARERDQAFARARARALTSRSVNTEESVLEVSARNWDTVEIELAKLLERRERHAEAEVVIRGVLERVLKRLGRDNVNTGQVIGILASTLHQQGRYQEAAQLAEAALDIFAKTSSVPESLGRATTHRVQARALAAQGLWAQALDSYERMNEGLSRDPESLARFGTGELNWGLALIWAGRAADAITLLDPELVRYAELYGDDSSQTALIRGALAIALGKQRQHDRAREEFARANRVLLESRSDDGDISPARALDTRRVLEGYIEFLFDSSAGKQAGFDPAAEAFRVADLARGQGVQRALGQSAARAAANDAALAAILRKEQDLEQEMRSLYGFLVNQLNVPSEQRLPVVVGNMRKRIAAIRAERKALLADIERRFPRYAELVNPRPASLEDARKALRPGEALISVLATEKRSFVWAIGSDGAVANHAATIGELQLGLMVEKLRRALDPGAAGSLIPYDFETAQHLYALLLEPVSSVWSKSDTLIVTAGGALAQLPLSALVTESRSLERDPNQLFGEYRGAAWLARKVAVAYAPSVNSFVRLRALPAPPARRTAFVGFGDPQFSAASVGDVAALGLRLRGLQIERVSHRMDLAKRSVEWTRYGSLTPLPDTREEILSIAKVLGATIETDVFLGREASRPRVKQTDLAGRRIVMFATHGLVPGDLPGLEQPALALAALDNAKESPLLTLEDILGLKLDADLVVLSACNTAAADGEGAEAISGLGRGFFYAGSRALLVTHWPVETVSAKLLTTGIFERYVKNHTLTRALRDSMLALLDSPGTPQYAYAHPLFWSPFALIGDGGR